MARRLPLFLERRNYRLRRLEDAARLLPVLGAVIFAVPLLWPLGEEGVPTSRAMIYLFGTWAGLAVLSGLLSWRLRQERRWLRGEAQDDARPTADGRSERR